MRLTISSVRGGLEATSAQIQASTLTPPGITTHEAVGQGRTAGNRCDFDPGEALGGGVCSLRSALVVAPSRGRGAWFPPCSPSCPVRPGQRVRGGG